MNKRIVYLILAVTLMTAGVIAVVGLWGNVVQAANQDMEWYPQQAETRTAQSVENIVRTGLTATYTAVPTDGIYFTNDGATFLHVKNASGGILTVTVQSQLTVDGLAVADLSVGVADSSEKFIGPFPTTTFNVQTGTYANKAYVDPSSYDAAFTMAILTF